MYKYKYGKWIVSEQKSYNEAGNMCAPSKVQHLKWVKECWSSLCTELNQKSFRPCGISMNVDGSEGVEIFCLKSGEVTAISTDLTGMLLQEDVSDEDLFAGVNNEDEGELE